MQTGSYYVATAVTIDCTPLEGHPDACDVPTAGMKKQLQSQGVAKVHFDGREL